jgi:hypothetical protein
VKSGGQTLHPVFALFKDKMMPSEQKYSCRSSIALPMQVKVGLVVDDVLDASVLRSKYAQLVELWPVLGGKLLSMVRTILFMSG